MFGTNNDIDDFIVVTCLSDKFSINVFRVFGVGHLSIYDRKFLSFGSYRYAEQLQ